MPPFLFPFPRGKTKNRAMRAEAPAQHDENSNTSRYHPSCKRIEQKGIITAWYGFPVVWAGTVPAQVLGCANTRGLPQYSVFLITGIVSHTIQFCK